MHHRPMFTQRHYRAIADMLAPLVRDTSSMTAAVAIATAMVVDTLALQFQRDNPRFNVKQFIHSIWN